jgi:hypothetical protein
MVNVVVTVESLASEIHSGMFGGPVPDALAALIEILATLRDAAGNTVITGLDGSGTWTDEQYPSDRRASQSSHSTRNGSGRRA